METKDVVIDISSTSAGVGVIYDEKLLSTSSAAGGVHEKRDEEKTYLSMCGVLETNEKNEFSAKIDAFRNTLNQLRTETTRLQELKDVMSDNNDDGNGDAVMAMTVSLARESCKKIRDMRREHESTMKKAERDLAEWQEIKEKIREHLNQLPTQRQVDEIKRMGEELAQLAGHYDEREEVEREQLVELDDGRDGDDFMNRTILVNRDNRFCWKIGCFCCFFCSIVPIAIVLIIMGARNHQQQTGSNSQECDELTAWEIVAGSLVLLLIPTIYIRFKIQRRACDLFTAFMCALIFGWGLVGVAWLWPAPRFRTLMDTCDRSAYLLGLVVSVTFESFLVFCGCFLAGICGTVYWEEFKGFREGDRGLYAPPVVFRRIPRPAPPLLVQNAPLVTVPKKAEDLYWVLEMTRFNVKIIRLVSGYCMVLPPILMPTPPVPVVEDWMTDIISEYMVTNESTQEKEQKKEINEKQESKMEETIVNIDNKVDMPQPRSFRSLMIHLKEAWKTCPMPLLLIVEGYIKPTRLYLVGGIDRQRWSGYGDDEKTWKQQQLILEQDDALTDPLMVERDKSDRVRWTTLQWMDLVTGEWHMSTEMSPEMLRARVHPNVCIVDGRIVVSGGVEFIPHALAPLIEYSERPVLRSMECFVSELGRWSKMPSMPSRRLHAVTISPDDRSLYIIGGTKPGSTAPCTRIDWYDSKTEKWSTSDEDAKLNFEHALPYMAACTHKGLIYLLGGKTTTTLTSDEVYQMTPNTCTFLKLPSMKTHRARASCAVLDNKLMVVGGTTGYLPVSAVECLDLNHAKKWRSLPECTVWYPSVAVVDDILYVVGVDENQWFSFTTGEWSSLPACPSHVPPRRHFTLIPL